MQSGRILVNGNDFYCGNSSSNPSQLAIKSMIPDVSDYVKQSDVPLGNLGNYSYPIEIGTCIDFHKIGSTADFDARLYRQDDYLYFNDGSTVNRLAFVNDISSASNGKVIWSKTSSGTASFTAPASRNYTFVLIGAGGGGGPSRGLSKTAGTINTPGGGGSGFVETAGCWLNAGQTVTINVGAGGNAGGGASGSGNTGSLGSDGGSTTVTVSGGSTYTAGGGSRGTSTGAGAGRRNGTSATWDTVYYGNSSVNAGGDGFEYPSNAEGSAMSGAGGYSGVVAVMSTAWESTAGQGVDGAVYII